MWVLDKILLFRNTTKLIDFWSRKRPLQETNISWERLNQKGTCETGFNFRITLVNSQKFSFL
nr:hypothetical protein [Zobellia laminariae]